MSKPFKSSGAEANSGTPSKYSVGTITYTKAGLISLFLYLLWGDFCFTLMETVVPSTLPLKFNAIGAPNWALGLVVVTIPNLMAATINPFISFRSDRFRSRWGRRIPFLAGATPFLAIFLILLGYSEQIGHWVHSSLLGGRVPEMTVLLVCIGGFMVCFQFFNLFITSVYYYLFNDVVPHAFLARFMALFRMVGGLAGAGYNYFGLKYANTHMQVIFLVAGVLYFIGFFMMCLKVKEGDYPPPPAYVGDSKGVLGAIRTYANECFTHRFYWYIFAANSCIAMTWASGAYALLNNTKYMGFDLAFLGKVAGVCGVLGIALLYPAGIVADRIHPLRVYLAAVFAQAFMGPIGIAFAFGRPLLSTETTTWIYLGLSAIWLPIGTLFGAAELPTLMKLFPQERYGQFCSANALIRSLALVVGGLACGTFLDFAKRFNPNPDYCYRFVSVWNTVFFVGATFCLFNVYKEWKRLGGLEGFVPPELDKPNSDASRPPSPAVAKQG